MSGAGDSDITVRIRAQTQDLDSQLAIAEQRVKQTAAAFKSAASEAAKAGTPTADLTSKVIAASAAAKVAKDDFVKLGGEVGGHGSISTATREFRALFDELSSGRTRMTPGTLAIIGQRVFGLGPAALAAYGGVAILAAGLAYLGIKALETAEAIDKIELSGLGTKGFSVTQDQIRQLIDTLDALPEVSSKDAEKIAASFATMKDRSAAAFAGLGSATEAWAVLTGQSADKAAEQLAKAFGDPTSAAAREFMTTLRGVTAAQIDAFDHAKEAGDTYGAQRIMLQALSATIDESKSKLVEHSASVHDNWRNFFEYILLIQGGMSSEEAHNTMLDEASSRWKKLTDAIHGAVGELGKTTKSPTEALSDAVNLASKIDTSRVRIAELKGDIAQLQAEIKDPAATDQMKENFRSAIEVAQKEITTLQNKKAFAGTGYSNAGQEEIAEAKLKVSEINSIEGLGNSERLSQTKQVWDDLLAGDKLNAAQRKAVELEMQNSLAAARKENERQTQEIARNTASTDVEIARTGLQEKRSVLDQEVSAGQITAQQRLDLLRQYVHEEEDIQLQALDTAERAYDRDSAAFAEKENEKRRVRAETAAQLQKIDADAAAATAQAWQKSNQSIYASEDTLIQGILSGTRTWQQIVFGTIQSFATKELEADAHYLTERFLLHQEAVGAQKATESGGLLVHILGETQKTAATATQTVARKGIQAAGAATENASILVRTGRWVASELGITTATATGEATRTAAKEAAQVTTKATESAMNVASVESYAAVAAAAAAASVAAIPIVGWAMAPGVAAATFAELQPYAGLAALDVGAWEIPSVMPALLHPGEAVVPKDFASGMRQNIRNGGVGGFGLATAPGSPGPSGGDTNLHYSPTINAPAHKTLPQLMERDSRWMLSWIQDQARSGALKMAGG